MDKEMIMLLSKKIFNNGKNLFGIFLNKILLKFNNSNNNNLNLLLIITHHLMTNNSLSLLLTVLMMNNLIFNKLKNKRINFNFKLKIGYLLIGQQLLSNIKLGKMFY